MIRQVAITFTTTDSGVTYAGGFTNNSYVDYYVNAKQAGEYTITLPLGAGSGDDAQWNADSLQVKINDKEIATLAIPTSGWEVFSNATCKFTASAAGTYKISVVAVGGAVNVADFTVIRTGEVSTEPGKTV